MTPEEAVKVLEQNDYCIKHLVPMVFNTSKADDDARFDPTGLKLGKHCEKCAEELWQMERDAKRLRRQRIEEAITVLKAAKGGEVTTKMKPMTAWVVVNKESGEVSKTSYHDPAVSHAKAGAEDFCYEGERVQKVLITPVEEEK